jgi:hypothetical protein
MERGRRLGRACPCPWPRPRDMTATLFFTLVPHTRQLTHLPLSPSKSIEGPAGPPGPPAPPAPRPNATCEAALAGSTCTTGLEVSQNCAGGPACTLSKPKSVRAYSGAVGACTCKTAESTCPAGTRLDACLCRVEQADAAWVGSAVDTQSWAGNQQPSWDEDSEEQGGDEKNFKPPPPSVSWALTSVQPTCGGVCSCSATNVKPIYAGKSLDRLVAQAICVACDSNPPFFSPSPPPQPPSSKSNPKAAAPTP